MIKLNIKDTRPLSVIYGITFLIMGLSAYSIFKPDAVADVSLVWAWISTLSLLVFSVIFYATYKTLNKPFFYLVVTAFVCWFGQAVGMFIPGGADYPAIINTFDPFLLHSAFLYAFISLQALFVVGLICGSRNDERNYTVLSEDRVLRGSINFVGVFMVAIGGYTYISRLVSNLGVSLTRGYSAIYDTIEDVSAADNIFANLELFFIPGIFLLIIANKNKKILVYVLSGVVVLSLLLSLLSGGRGGAVSLLIAFYWLMSREFKKVGSINRVLIIATVFTLVAVMGTLAEFRLVDDRSVGSFLSIMMTGGVFHAVVSALNEFGFNIFSLYHTMALVPSVQDYAHGYTYFASVMAIIPSLFFGGFSFSSAADLPNWLKDSLAMDYGPGFSITAESYYNFGWFGLVAIVIIGYILSSVFSNSKSKGEHKSLRNVFIAVALYATLLLARGTTLLTFRKYFYMIIVPSLFIFAVYWWRKSKTRRLND